MSQDKEAEIQQYTEILRLVKAVDYDYIEAAYHLHRFVRSVEIPGIDTMQELKSAVLSLNSLRASANGLFSLIEPRAKF